MIRWLVCVVSVFAFVVVGCSRQAPATPGGVVGSAATTGVVPIAQAIDKGSAVVWTGPVILTASTDGHPTEIEWDFDDGSSALVCSETAGGGVPTCQGEWCQLTQTPLPPVRTFTAPGTQFVAASLDADGTTDIAVVSASSISILRGNGIGGFAAKGDVEGGGVDIVAADFDLDGVIDLATVSSTSTSIYLGTGDGTFPARTDYAGGGLALAAADFDEDGFLDLAFAEGNSTTLGVGLRFGNGDGTFGVRAQMLMDSGATRIVTGHFNGDSHVDVVVTSVRASGSQIISRRFGNGDGTFQPPSANTPAHANMSGLSVVDLEGDGLDDLIFTMASPETLGVFRPNGASWLHNTYSLLFQSNPEGTAAADVNGDGAIDVIVANASKSTFSVLYGSVSTPGGFNGYVGYPVVGSGSQEILATDLNGDGIKDAAILQPASSRVSTVLGGAGGGFGDRTLYPVPSDPRAFALADFDGDGLGDLAIARSGTVGLDRGFAPGKFSVEGSGYTGGTNPADAVADDLSRDGLADLVTTNNGSNSISVFLGTTAGLATRVDYAVGTTPTGTAIADVNEDGRLDLLVANGQGANSLSVLLAAGAEGSFGAKVDYPAGSAPGGVAVADMNEDGDLDALLPVNGGGVSVLLGSGTGIFGARTEYPSPSNPKALAVADFDNDGHLDVVTANTSTPSISILLGAGDGSLSASTSFPTGTNPESIDVADFDLDGFADVVVANQTSGTVSIFPGNGDGSFDPRQDISVGGDARRVVVADIAGDSGNDIVVLHSKNLDDYQLTIFEIQPTWSCAASMSHVYLDSKGTGTGPQFTFQPRLSVLTTETPIVQDLEVTVSDVPPIVTLGTSPAAEGALAVLAASWQHPCSNDAYLMHVEWGDGAESDIPVGVGVKAAGATHLYPNGGFYAVTVDVTDDEGVQSAVESFTQDVFDAPILLNSLQTNSPVVIGSVLTVTAVLENIQGDVYTFDFDWDGDGDYFGIDDVLGSTEPTAGLARTMPEVATVGVRIHDDEGNVETSSLFVQWIGTNGGGSGSPPFAVDQAFETDEDVPLGILTADFLVGAFDPDGDEIYFASTSQPAHGVLNLSGSVLFYTPDPHFHGVDSFFFTIVDAFGASASATAFVTVSSVNQPPSPSPDSLVTTIGRNITVAASSLLANDTDTDGDTLDVAGVLSAVNGAVVMSAADITFTPAAGFSGAASFEYSVTDGVDIATGSVVVTVLQGNAPPVAVTDAVSTTEGAAVSVDVAILIANDSDPDGDAIAFASTGQPAHGVSSLAGSLLTYTPDAGFSGTDSFLYTIVDAVGATALGTVTVSVSPVNHAPAAVSDSAVTSEGVALQLPVSYLLANDSDPDGDVIDVTDVGPLSNGTVSLSAGVVTFTPTAAFEGLGSFNYTLRDGVLETTGTVFVSVLGVDHIPGIPGVVSPAGGVVVDTTTPTLALTAAADADGDNLEYEFEIDRVPTFDGQSLQQSGLLDVLQFVPAALSEDLTWYWRARAHDGASAGNWVLAHFHVNSTNAPPTTPVAIAPVNGQVIDSSTFELRVLNATDIDGSQRTYLFTISRDSAGADVVETSTPIPEGATETRWHPSTALDEGTTYYWTSRALDDEGLEGPISAAEAFSTPAEAGRGSGGGGCACSISPRAERFPALGTLALSCLAVALLVARRRSIC